MTATLRISRPSSGGIESSASSTRRPNVSSSTTTTPPSSPVGAQSAGCFGRFPEAAEVLAEGLGLTLVVGADLTAVEQRRLLEHPLEGELADPLAVLDHERPVVRAHLESCRRAGRLSRGVVAEPGVEETGV